MEKIEIRVHHRLMKGFEETGDNDWNNGNTYLEMDAQSDGDICLRVENRGFERKSKNAARVFFNKETAIEMIEYLNKYLEIKEKLDAIKDIK